MHLAEECQSRTTFWHSCSNGSLQSDKAAILLDALLQNNHSLLITRRILRLALKFPLQELVGKIGLEPFVQNTQSLAVSGNLLPIALHVLQISAEIRKAPLEDLAIGRRVENRLDVQKLLPGLGRFGEDEIGSPLAGAHERFDFVRVGG